MAERFDTSSAERPWTREIDHVAGVRPEGDPLRKPNEVGRNNDRSKFRWWMPGLAWFCLIAGLFVVMLARGESFGLDSSHPWWWVVTLAVHIPFAVILCFLVGGFIERLGFFWRGRAPEMPGRLPEGAFPHVCVQLPMFNEHAVAQRVIEAACAIDWPRDRFSVQVLDDSTDPATRRLVSEVCASIRRRTGVDCQVLHRTDRSGYKAGALEAGRKATDAEFLAIFDSDFLPHRDFLIRAIPHFYKTDGTADTGLAMVQTQWGHLNHDKSALTRAQSLWVDDHHTLQMSWRSAKWQFVNFAGTAGIWRASAVETAGGWRAASLVEDCELSFRHLFAGYRTKFVKEIVAPAELPATYTAYKAQQRRWTQGWAQLQRLHLPTLLFAYRCSPAKRAHLVYHMCISLQWPTWAVWITLLPFLIMSGHWFAVFGTGTGVLLYLVPTALWAALAATLATAQAKHTYPEPRTWRVLLHRMRRAGPYLVINTGMLPHQFSAFAEGLFGKLHSEFERTPKVGDQAPTAPAAARRPRVRIHWSYVAAEVLYVAYQFAWMAYFATQGLVLCALVAGYMAACVLYVGYFYGDDAGKVCFAFTRPSGGRLGRQR